ncbi:hypothetical protein HYG81_17860 [Natrinema zhouii]|uniref:PGF-CTERM sorting domain-containing protein n=1 Tax=Natrinema zhouii TaxID=1710539 RepID=A0A7D6CNG5_9EURY|nr:hypothetical protein [Natrinema zhouii]QLK25917.1 hypothetical protein HYG81_17860 [Natrinema zhouii]
MERPDADSATTARRGRADESASISWPRSRRRTVTALVVGLVVCLVTLPAPIAAASEGPPSVSGVDTTATAAAESTLVVTDATVEPGTTTTHRIALTDAPDGLAGFEVTLELSGDATRVSNASYPDAYGLTTEPITSADGRSVTVEAADLTDEVTPGATDVTLATVEVNATETATGSTTLRVTESQVDADDGSRIEPALESGTLTVGEDGPTAASSQDEGDGSEGEAAVDGAGPSGSDSSEPVPGFAAGSAIGAIAVLAAALLARSR